MVQPKLRSAHFVARHGSGQRAYGPSGDAIYRKIPDECRTPVAPARRQERRPNQSAAGQSGSRGRPCSLACFSRRFCAAPAGDDVGFSRWSAIPRRSNASSHISDCQPGSRHADRRALSRGACRSLPISRRASPDQPRRMTAARQGLYARTETRTYNHRHRKMSDRASGPRQDTAIRSTTGPEKSGFIPLTLRSLPGCGSGSSWAGAGAPRRSENAGPSPPTQRCCRSTGISFSPAGMSIRTSA